MKKITAIIGATAFAATGAYARDIDRSGQSVGILFDQGNYAEFSFGYAQPKVSGTSTAGAIGSGDMAADFSQIGGAVKFQINESLDAAIIVDQPFGADTDYPTGTGYFAAGSTAELNTMATTGILKYRMPSNISVYGGLRYQTLSAKANIPFIASYTADGEKDAGLGYLVGVAYERPEIALRVALTYNSKITHKLSTAETSLVSPDTTTTTTIDTPQSVNLEFQSGVAKDTLVFGSLRWVEWSAFDITPTVYQGLTGGASLVSYDDDTITYTLGVGRRLNETWAVAASVGYEKANGGFASNLGPNDGRKSVTLGATYTRDKMKVTGGVSYIEVGDAQTTLGGGVPASNFTNNSAVAFGLKVGYRF